MVQNGEINLLELVGHDWEVAGGGGAPARENNITGRFLTGSGQFNSLDQVVVLQRGSQTEQSNVIGVYTTIGNL